MKLIAGFLAGMVLTLGVVLFWLKSRPASPGRVSSSIEESPSLIPQQSDQRVGAGPLHPPPIPPDDVVELSQQRYLGVGTFSNPVTEDVTITSPSPKLHMCSNQLGITTMNGGTSFYPIGWSDSYFTLQYVVCATDIGPACR